MISAPVLALGFFAGMQHALEADHVAAVSSIAARGTRVADVIKHGLTWGLGHTMTLFLFAGAAIAAGSAIPDTFAQSLESTVGVMLLGLGGQVLWRLRRDRASLELRPHLHAHGRERIAHVSGYHERGFRWRSLAVGLMHGMAGSAALLIVALSAVTDSLQAVAYIALFGIGSILGMGALSSVIAVPLVISARKLTWANSRLQATVGILTIAVGVRTIYTILVHANV